MVKSIVYLKKKKHSVGFMHSVKLGVGDAKVVAQTVEPSPSIHKGHAQSSCLTKLAAQSWNLSALQVEAGNQEFKVVLGYLMSSGAA